jgi:hypothetical protein
MNCNAGSSKLPVRDSNPALPEYEAGMPVTMRVPSGGTIPGPYAPVPCYVRYTRQHNMPAVAYESLFRSVGTNWDENKKRPGDPCWWEGDVPPPPCNLLLLWVCLGAQLVYSGIPYFRTEHIMLYLTSCCSWY